MNKKEGSSQSQQFLITIICVLGLTFMLFRVNILAHSVFLYRIEYLCRYGLGNNKGSTTTYGSGKIQNVITKS